KQLVSMITPEASPTGDSHGTPTVEDDCSTVTHPRHAPYPDPLRLQRRGHREGLLLGGDLRPPYLLGLPQRELAAASPQAVAALAGHDVAAAARAGRRGLAERSRAPGYGSHGAGPVLDD